MKILVVDDSAVMRKLIARSIGSVADPSVEIVEAADGMHALAMIARHGTSIDFILCDMNMPNVDGLSLLKSLRGSPEFRHIPFVIVTADESDEPAARALREGAASVLGKPFQPEVIAALVRRRRTHGRRATSGVFKTDTVTRMVQSLSRSARRDGTIAAKLLSADADREGEGRRESPVSERVRSGSSLSWEGSEDGRGTDGS